MRGDVVMWWWGEGDMSEWRGRRAAAGAGGKWRSGRV